MPELYETLYLLLINTKRALILVDGKKYQLFPGGIKWPIDKVSSNGFVIKYGYEKTEDDEFLMEYGVFKNEE